MTSLLLRVDNQDLSFLAVGAGSAVQEHWIGAGDGHTERAYGGLAIDKRNMARVDCCRYRSLKWLASNVLCGLGDGMVTIAELELDNIANRCRHNVGHKGILWATDNYRYDLIRLGCSMLVLY